MPEVSYEQIDEASVEDTFTKMASKIMSFSEVTEPDIKERLRVEKHLKTYLKVSNPAIVLNFILELIYAINGQESKEKDH
jgi:hypothetical protein